MALNLKNPQTLAAIDELARLTGESKAQAVASAIEAQLAQILEARRTQARDEEIAAIIADSSRRMRAAGFGRRPDGAWSDPTDDLYDDEYGLPR
jgi:antitoxin VapB